LVGALKKGIGGWKDFKKLGFLSFFQFRAVWGVKQGRKNQRNTVFSANSGVITPTAVSTLVVINFSSFFRL